jgi:hypothetical protein
VRRVRRSLLKARDSPLPRGEAETNAINRVLKARGLPALDQPGVVAHLATMVQDHGHLMELLRACDPVLRRQMYEAMSPYLRFTAWPLESYIMEAKERAAQLPTVDAAGELHPPTIPVIEIPEVELVLDCSRCQKQTIFLADDEHTAKREARLAGWQLGLTIEDEHVCPNCAEEQTNALDASAS